MPAPDLSLLRLSLLPGVGPVTGRRLVEHFGSAAAVFDGGVASARSLEQVRGIGDAKARAIHAAIPASERLLHEELALAGQLGVRFVTLGHPDYPPVLAALPDAPLVLSVLGDAETMARMYAVAVVGSRSATQYGVEQAERFAAAMAQAGLCIVSGGARGIDTAAHRAALRVNGATVAVLGCGLAHRYPPENAELFDRILRSGGAILSELPLNTGPAPENFPARNRIISGLSLGVVVIEAPAQSGALITARVAAEEQGREVFALPGRVDSKSSEGCHELVKAGGAALVTTPADVIDALESAARHQHAGTHAARFAPPAAHGTNAGPEPADLFGSSPAAGPRPPLDRGTRPIASASLTETQRALLGALAEPKSLDELAAITGLALGPLQAEVTMLELRRLIVREGPRLARRIV